MKLIAYLRVSSAKQAGPGPGLETQAAAVGAYADRQRGQVLATFTEVESGKANHRPELGKALDLARVTGATVLIAELDRLSRNAAFLLTLKDSGVRFVAADMPDANEQTVGLMVSLAQHEREISAKRTKKALQAAKARGQVLGNPNGADALRRAGKGNSAGVRAAVANADTHAAKLAPVVAAMRGEGIVSLGDLAEALNDRGIPTPRGGRWHKSSVRNLLARLEAASGKGPAQ